MSPRRALVLATIAFVAGQSAHTTFMYYLVPLALRAGGLSSFDAVAFALIAVAMGAFVVPAGRLADRVPRRRVLRIGVALLGLAYATLLPPPQLGLILSGTVMTGAGLACLFVSFNSYVADLLGGSARSAAYGRTTALSVLAGAIGPVVAASVLRQAGEGAEGIRLAASIFGVLTLLAVALTWGLPSARGDETPASAEAGRGPRRARPDRRAVAPIMLLYVLMGAGYGMTLPYFAVYFLDHVRLDGVAWGYVLGGATALSALGSFVSGRLAARIRPTTIAIGGQVGLAVASLAFVLPLAAPLLTAAYLARSCFAASTGPVVNAALMDRVAEGVRGESQGYVSLAWNVGWATGATAGGILLARLGGATFPLGAALALGGVLVGVAWLARTSPTPKPPSPDA